MDAWSGKQFIKLFPVNPSQSFLQRRIEEMAVRNLTEAVKWLVYLCK